MAQRCDVLFLCSQVNKIAAPKGQKLLSKQYSRLRVGPIFRLHVVFNPELLVCIHKSQSQQKEKK